MNHFSEKMKPKIFINVYIVAYAIKNVILPQNHNDFE